MDSNMAALDASLADPAIAAKQRKLVDTQLAAMYTGNTPRLFSVVGELFQELREQGGLEAVTLLEAGWEAVKEPDSPKARRVLAEVQRELPIGFR